MAEVPEHLLQRSAARRALLTGEGGGEDAPAATPAVAGGAAPAAAATAGPPPKVTPTEPAFKEPIDRAAFQRVEGIRKRRIPVWALSVLATLPVWGMFYVGAFGERPTHHEEVETGQSLYADNCASCHGANGGGGAGPKLSGGEAILTFPAAYADGTDGREAHIEWVKTGSTPFKGENYGDPNRAGGQKGPASGGMPGFQGKLTDEQIEMIVDYERDEL